MGLTIGKSNVCSNALIGNGLNSSTNRVKSLCKVDINESWTIGFDLDGFKSQTDLSYLFSSTGWYTFRCFSNGVAGPGNVRLRTGNWNLNVNNVIDSQQHRLIFVHDKGNKIVKAYLDNKFAGSSGYADSLITSVSAEDSLVVAGYGTSATLESGSMLDNFMVFSYAIDTTKLGLLPQSQQTYDYSVSGCGDEVSATNGRKFTQSGTYYDTLVGTGDECDTLIVYNVQLYKSFRDTQSINACGSYVLNGRTYTSSTTVIDSFKNVYGCDSLYISLLNISQPTSEKKQVSVCGSYTTSKGVVLTQSTTYFDTFTTVNGCDSVIFMDITINNSTLDSQSIGVCGYYVNVVGDTLRTSTTYFDTFINVNGCDSVIKMIVDITTVNTGVTQTGNTLTADETSATYAWLDCNNAYAAISGETAATFAPTENGSYAVAVTVNSCTDTSDCVVISGLSVSGLVHGDFIIAPNPNNGVFTISSNIQDHFTATIIDVNGKECYYRFSKSKNGIHVDMSNLPNGIYFIKIMGSNSSAEVKVIKDR